MAEKKEPGILYLCPTPIGNLEDITLRVLRVLKEVDYIAAEDTRVTRKLLNHYGIKTPLTSYREHNRAEKGEEIVRDLLEGKSVALVSDAGTPGISDPGEDLVKKAVEAGIRVVPLPGPSAVICAVAASGLSTGKFVFEGFLPQKSSERRKRLAELKDEERTIVFYEAPHRLLKSLSDIREILGNRRITVAREMTKVHEEFFRGSVEEAVMRYRSEPPRGEIVLVLEGFRGEKPETGGIDLEDEESRRLLLDRIRTYMNQGMDKKKAMKTAAKELGVSRREAYKLLVESEKE
ncbi:16S rRNA (cytidine(1402)-2'-O)-methyltransferase [Thermosediminibacter litoriperuensis]|uniref:Ribosomal RNA small subunit methyltransferase I n=1 Tax=Thermosediminibacter litoriperuensis TaxID=291989 RepID=A0A5S5AX18_9FIRM|nr:16S rRNA (cytidine(1402)-2'-O)-methyltransferase [Thermosediminibacter litoriperuensis]TYP57380.1 16S rRNA (cytidine1402-2'-O)-methyltransferase [Thermosediminibacter litoriperuensis]